MVALALLFSLLALLPLGFVVAVGFDTGWPSSPTRGRKTSALIVGQPVSNPTATTNPNGNSASNESAPVFIAGAVAVRVCGGGRIRYRLADNQSAGLSQPGQRHAKHNADGDSQHRQPQGIAEQFAYPRAKDQRLSAGVLHFRWLP
jgi:hypothetical protein